MVFSNLKVGHRLAAGFALVTAFVIGITILGVSRLSSVDDGTNLIVRDRYPKVALANQILDRISAVAIDSRNAAASAEQSAGIEQVSQAVGQMDQVTQQNAALVEQAAAASGAMHDQATSLAKLVSIFRLDPGQSKAGNGRDRQARAKKQADSLGFDAHEKDV